MLVREFRDFIQKGVGSAVCYLQNHPDRAYKYEDAIYHACIRYTGYDLQSEGTREHYLWELIQRSGRLNELQERILKAMPKLKGDDLLQVFRLAKYFVQNGNDYAIQVMKANFRYDSIWNLFIGAEELIEVAGWEGLLFVAEAEGKLMLQDTDYLPSEVAYMYAQKRLGVESVSKWFEQEGNHNPLITRYYASVIQSQSLNYIQTLIQTYADVKRLIEQENYRFNHKLLNWGLTASTEDLVLAAQDFLQETDLRKCLNYLSIFGKVTYPGDPSKILELAQSENEELIHATRIVLGHIKDLRVREYAFVRYQSNPKDYRVLQLLQHNYQTEDLSFLEKLLFAVPLNKDDLHELGSDIISIYSQNHDPRCLPMLLHLYQSGDCGYCRSKLIQLMITQNLLPDWMREEARYDSYPKTRKLIRNYLHRDK